jgi:hypothetical protein
LILLFDKLCRFISGTNVEKKVSGEKNVIPMPCFVLPNRKFEEDQAKKIPLFSGIPF